MEISERTDFCSLCKRMSDCCRTGVWVDLEEAKKILELALAGEFFQLEQDKDFPSGYKISTSPNDDPCTFLDPDGLCSIHKVDYGLKPSACKDFPYDKGSIAKEAEYLCTVYIDQRIRCSTSDTR